MASLKHRIEQLEKSKLDNMLTPAEAIEIGKSLQGCALIPGKYPGHVDYEPPPSENYADKRTVECNKRVEELLKKLGASSSGSKSV
jgi:hypothetical protein